MSHPAHSPDEWIDARQRAEIYLQSLLGAFGAAEEALVESAVASARLQARLNPSLHPVALTMEALLGFLPAEAAPAMTPPMQRARMLPESLEFPVHEWMARLFGRGFAH